MWNNETFTYDKFDDGFESKFLSIDIYTAASLGDVSFFMKYDTEKLNTELSIPNLSGWTPLMYACAMGHSSLVNYLLKSGASRKSKTESGVTSLMLAICSGDLSTVETIFDPSDMEEKDYKNWTPLFYAVHFTREKCLNYLLRKGANVNIVDFQNETPLLVAVKLGRETMVELILKFANNLDVVSYKKESAIMLARESSNIRIRTIVKEHYEYLKRSTEIERGFENKNELNTVKVFFKKTSPQQKHLTTPIKQKIKTHLNQLRMNKSLTYSPNKSSQCSPQTPQMGLEVSPVWKLFPKKFCSPQSNQCIDVEKLLKSLGLEKYWPIFRDEEVDFETLLTLNEDNLKELGISLFGPRKKIILAIQHFRNKRS